MFRFQSGAHGTKYTTAISFGTYQAHAFIKKNKNEQMSS